jgi:DNA-binding winged helix-turn-helix (wHTH) protein
MLFVILYLWRRLTMAGYPQEGALLVAQAGPLNGQQWIITDSIILGRDDSATIVIPDRQVSRHHARIFITSGGVYLEDLGSKNGTHHNGQPFEGQVQLQDSDVIQIALVQKFVFISPDATLPLNISPPAFSGNPPPTEFQKEPDRSSLFPDSTPVTSRLRLDKRSHRVWITIHQRIDGELRWQEKEVLPPLSISQYLLLEFLYENTGEVVSREALVRHIWGQEQSYEISEQALDALVRRLRERLQSIDPSFDYIKTVRGHGLRLENQGY